MERVKKSINICMQSNGSELMHYHEYLNQQRKIMEAHSVIAPQNKESEHYTKVKYELQYEFHRLKQRRAKKIEEENQKMYNRLRGILTNTNQQIRRGSPIPPGPTSLNFVYRKNTINKINEENNAFLSKLQHIKPSVPNVQKLIRVQENQDSYKQFASQYQNGKKRQDPLVDRHMRLIMSSSKIGNNSRMQSVRTLNSSLPSINQSKIALLTTGTDGGIVNNYGAPGRSNSNSISGPTYNSEHDQYVVNFDELVKRNQSMGDGASKSPRAIAQNSIDYPNTMVFDENRASKEYGSGSLSSRPSKNSINNYYVATYQSLNPKKRSISVQKPQTLIQSSPIVKLSQSPRSIITHTQYDSTIQKIIGSNTTNISPKIMEINQSEPMYQKQAYKSPPPPKQVDPFSPLDESVFTKVQVKVGHDEFASSIGKGGFLDKVAQQQQQ